MTAQNITLTPVAPGVTEYIQATQGENNARSLTFRILDATGQPLDLTGCTVAFYVDRRESGVVQVAATVTDDNAAEVTLPSGACNVPGEWGCWVQLIKPEVFDLRADNLILRVQPCDIDQAAEASDEFGLLTQLITQAQEAIEDAGTATGAANAAASAANTAAGTANSAAGEASSAASAATEAASSANSAKEGAESAANAANTAAGAASTAAGTASSAAGEASSAASAANAAAQAANEAAEEAATTAEATATTVATNVVNQQKGTANGLATLDSSGKLAQMPAAADVGAVPVSRTVNGKALSSNITLTAADVGAALPNLLLNSDFAINQRGQASYPASSTQYTYDRWLAAYATITREANTSPAPVPYMAKCVFQNTNWPNFGQTLENYSQYVGGSLTVRFWIKGLAGTSSVTLWVGDSSHVIALSGQWQEVTHTFDPVTEGTVSFSRKGILLQSSTANPAAGTGFYLAAPQVCVGPSAGVYTPPVPAEELVKCQRYYEKGSGVLVWVEVESGTYRFPPIQFKAEKYKQPTVTIKDGDSQAIIANEVSTSMFSGYRTSGARENTFTFTADAEIYS